MRMKSERSPKEILLQGFISGEEFGVLTVKTVGALKYLVIEIESIYAFISACALITRNCVLSAGRRV